jgi:two-component system sensor histidine kinase/response regulator
MNKHLHRIINRGIKEDDEREVRRQIGLLNMATLLCFSTVSIFIVINIVQHNWILLVNNVILVALTTCLLYISRLKFFNTSIIILTTLFSVYFFINALLFHNALQYAILVMMAISVLLIHSGGWRIVMLGMQIALFMVYVYYQNSPAVIPPIPWYRGFITTFAMLVIFACMLQYFKRKQLQYLKSLGRLNAQLQESNQVKERMLSILSHDFNAPVANLVTTLGLVDAELLTPAEFNDVSVKLKRQLQVLTTSLADVLHWSKMQISGADGKPGNIYVKELVDDIHPLFQYSLDEKKLALINKLDSNHHVYANKQHVTLIFRNLLSNAIKYSHQGGSIFIDAEILPAKLKIRVQDEGTGMLPGVLEALQTEQLAFNSTPGTAKEKGTGLGLLLVREFVQKNNGELVIQSKLGKGSTFYVLLPYDEDVN